MITLNDSPIQPVQVDGHALFVKRDDLLHRDFSGNKARKLFYLLNQDLSSVGKIVSFGSAQSNAMYSIAVLAKMRKVRFVYYVDHIPSTLFEQPAGNYKAALENGAEIIPVGSLRDEGETLEQYVTERLLPAMADVLYVPEGGRYEQASVGVYQLADEIAQWFSAQRFERLQLMLPSGTGTTALFLQKRFVQLSLPIEVLTCACVGGDACLLRQFSELETDERFHPRVLPSGKKFHFGKLYLSFYQMWAKLKQQTGIEFDLLYDPQGWGALLAYLNVRTEDAAVLYIHQGGILGNETMLPRYQRKYDICQLNTEQY